MKGMNKKIGIFLGMGAFVSVLLSVFLGLRRMKKRGLELDEDDDTLYKDNKNKDFDSIIEAEFKVTDSLIKCEEKQHECLGTVIDILGSFLKELNLIDESIEKIDSKVQNVDIDLKEEIEKNREEIICLWEHMYTVTDIYDKKDKTGKKERISVIDRCLPKIYKKYFDNPQKENMSILQDLYDMLRSQEEEVGKKLAVEMEIYVKGSLNVFNHHTNVDTSNRVVCYDIKELGKQLKKIGMLVVQDQVWNKVTINREGKKATRYYADEFHLLLKEPQTANYSIEIWKRFLKWGGMPTGLTQNIKDLLASPETQNIFDNIDFILMLNQAPGDREILAKKLNISINQLSYITNSNEGEGLIFYGNTIVPFVDNFPKDTKLYSLITTKPLEIKNGK
jgi:putative conjugal transfer protein